MIALVYFYFKKYHLQRDIILRIILVFILVSVVGNLIPDRISLAYVDFIYFALINSFQPLTSPTHM